jgi:hypothetical protein
MPHISYLDKNERVLKDLRGGDPLPCLSAHCFEYIFRA